MSAATQRVAPEGRPKRESVPGEPSAQDILCVTSSVTPRVSDRVSPAYLKRGKGAVQRDQFDLLRDHLIREAISRAGLTRSGELILRGLQKDIWHRRRAYADFGVSQIAELGGWSPATVRRTMSTFVKHGLATVAVQGSRGAGLQTVWTVLLLDGIHQAEVVAEQLTLGGRLPGRARSKKAREATRKAVATWQGITGALPPILRGGKFQNEALLGVPPCSVPEQGETPIPHPISETTPGAREANGMAGESPVNQEKPPVQPSTVVELPQAVTDALVQLGLDQAGATRLRGVSAKAAADLADEAKAIASGLARVAEHGSLEDLAGAVAGQAGFKSAPGIVMHRIKTDPRRFRASLQDLVRSLEARIEAQQATLHRSRITPAQLAQLGREVREALATWERRRQEMPSEDAPDRMDARQEERRAYRVLLAALELELGGAAVSVIRGNLRCELRAGGLTEGDVVVWNHSFNHHFGQRLMAAAGLENLLVAPEGHA